MLRRLLPVLLLSLICREVSAEQAATSISSYRWHTYALLLTAADPVRLKLGAREIEEVASSDTALTDLAAKAVDDFLQHRRSLDADTVAWLARGLGATGSLRYADLLTTLSKNDERKIAEYASAALAKLKTPAPTFNATDVDLDAVRAQLEKQTEQSASSEVSLFQMQQGMWIENAFEKLGYPTDVRTTMTSRRIPMVPGRIYVTNLVLDYGSKGDLEFSRDKGDWYVVRVLPRNLPARRGAGQQAPIEMSVDDMRQGILAPDPLVMTATVKNAIQRGVTDEAILDTAAWRLAAEMHTKDKYMVDGLAYICRLLGNSANPRYRNLAVEVASKADARKLQAYAEKMLTSLPDQQVEQYTGDHPPQ